TVPRVIPLGETREEGVARQRRFEKNQEVVGQEAGRKTERQQLRPEAEVE
ncbi:hypothetical protein TorRG33x02_262340, partial [Trema orientale]